MATRQNRNKGGGGAWLVGVCAAMWLVPVAPAFAQPGSERTVGMLQWAVAAGVVVVVCMSAFINPKRSHKD